MKKRKILLIAMLIVTLIYISAVVYANSSVPTTGGVDAAFLYPHEPEEWYTPEQIGIVEILGYCETATWIHVVYGFQGPLVNPDEQPIFKYQGKFWQIADVHVTPGLPEHVKKWQVPIGGAIAAGWIFTGIVFFKEKEKSKTILAYLVLLLLSLIFPNVPVTSAATQSSRDLWAFPALPEHVRNAEPQTFPENSITIEYLNTTNPYSSQINPLGEESEEEGSNPLYVLVFGDEEGRARIPEWTPPGAPIYWDEWTLYQLERGDEALISNFGIDIRVLGFLEWDSDDSKDSMYELWDELVAETKSYLGQWYEGAWWQNYVDAIIGITDQSTPVDDPPIAGIAPGPIPIDKGDIFCLLKWQVHWADDNLVQHEISHIFYADDEYPLCGVMATHEHYQYFIWEDCLWPVFDYVPCGYTSYSWDSYNQAIIKKYKSSYTDESHNGMLIIRQGPLVFPFTIRGTASWDYGVHVDLGGNYHSISINSVSPGYKFDYWLVNGVTKVYSNTITIYVPQAGKVRLAAYFKESPSPRRGGGGSGRCYLM